MKFKEWLDGGMYQYRRGYMLTHPWLILDHWKDEIVYAWERVFKGYDSRVSWSVDYYLAEKIPLWVKEVKEFQGFPTTMFEDDNWEHTNKEEEIAKEKWNNILDTIIDGFNMYTKMNEYYGKYDDPEYLELKRKFELGFDNFRKYYDCLWT